MRTYEVARKYLEKTKKCLTWDPDTQRLFMGDAIDLTQRIGSPSDYGIVYLSKGKGMGRLLRVACKIMSANQTNKKEIAVLEKVTDQVVNNNFMNFPLSYAAIECDRPICKKKGPCPSNIFKKKHLVLFNELADGDLKQWLHQDTHNVDAYLSAIFQIYMGLAKLGSMKYVHDDMHWGNALYHKVPVGGWWWYRVVDKDYYIRNTGQMWVIWDFGKVKNVKSKLDAGSYMFTDFYRIIHAFIQKDQGGWMEDRMYPRDVTTVSLNILRLVSTIRKIPFDAIIAQATNTGVPLPIQTQLPTTERVLNDRPFTIPS